MKIIFAQMCRAIKLTGVRVLGAAAMLLLQMQVGKFLGVEGSGYFYTSLMLVSIAATLACFGADVGIVRCASIYKERCNWTQLEWSLRKYIFLALLLSVSVVLISVFAVPYLNCAAKLDTAAANDFVSYYVFLVILMSLGMIVSGAHNGVGNNSVSVSMLQLLPYSLALFFISLFHEITFAGFGLALILGWSVSLFYGIFFLRKSVPSSSLVAVGDPSEEVKTHLFDLFLFQLLVQIYTWAGVAIISTTLTVADAGVFGAAQRISIVISFLLTSLTLMNRPRFASLYAAGDILVLQSLVGQTTRIMAVIAFPLFFVLAFYSQNVMALFGRDFERGAIVLTILAFGQTVNAVLGSVGHLLNMTGHSKDMRNVMLVCVPFSVFFTWSLAELYGVHGAAVGSALGMVAVNGCIVVMVKRRTGVVPVKLA